MPCILLIFAYPALYSIQNSIWDIWGFATTAWISEYSGKGTGFEKKPVWVHCLTQGDISVSGFRLGSLSFSEPKKNTTFQSCPIPWDSMDHSSPDSSVHGILQARILKWVAIPFSREYSQPREQTQVCHTAGRFFTIWATREAFSRAWHVLVWSFRRT